MLWYESILQGSSYHKTQHSIQVYEVFKKSSRVGSHKCIKTPFQIKMRTRSPVFWYDVVVGHSFY
jgi:hypothetical protein